MAISTQTRLHSVFTGVPQAFSNIGRAEKYPFEEKEHINISVEDLDVANASDILENILKTNIVPFLWGPPGVGKSSIVRDLAQRIGWKCIDLRLSLLNPVDLRGLPVVNKKMERADWYPPSFLPHKDTQEPGILFLDEINLAPPSVQAAAYQLILDKKVGEYEFPHNWRMIAAGNREGIDKANVYKLPAPLLNRFVHFDIQPNFSSWREWAKDKGIRQEILDFLAIRQEHLYSAPRNGEKSFPTPRSWEHLSELLTVFGFNAQKPPVMRIKQIIVATIGEAVGKEFIATLDQIRHKMVEKTVKQYIKTGKLDMPRNEDERQGLAVALYRSYAVGELAEDKYLDFVRQLPKEEQRYVDHFDRTYGKLLRERASLPKPDFSTTDVAVLTRPIQGGDITIEVSDTRILKPRHPLLVFGNNGQVELMEAEEVEGNRLYNVRRGLLNTKALSWPKGTKIQVYSQER